MLTVSDDCLPSGRSDGSADWGSGGRGTGSGWPGTGSGWPGTGSDGPRSWAAPVEHVKPVVDHDITGPVDHNPSFEAWAHAWNYKLHKHIQVNN